MPVVVEASSVADYLARYYKQDRLKDVDKCYGDGHLLQSYEYDFEVYGFVSTSHFDNVTGQYICWPEYKEITQEQVDRRQSYPDYIKSGKDPAAVSLGRRGGKVRSEKKAEKARENGVKGGRKKQFSALDMGET